MIPGPGVLSILAALLPAAIGLALWRYARRRRTVAAALGDPSLLARLSGRDPGRPPRRRIAFVLAASIALSAALLASRAHLDAADATSGSDLVIVLDVSNSMLVEDVPPNRLEAARSLALDVVRERPNARIGLVVFAGEATVLAPPTRDHATVRMLLEIAAPEFATQTGSDAAAGLRQATALLAGNPGGGTVLLFSDGEPVGEGERAENLADAVRRATMVGATVHAVATGTPRGGPVPDIEPESGARIGWKREPGTGEIAISALDAESLEAMAAPTGGEVFVLSDGTAGSVIMDRTRDGTGPGPARTAGFPAPYAWFCGLALLLLLAERLLDGRDPGYGGVRRVGPGDRKRGGESRP
jgi:Ca-activated chloride channel homolog